MYVLVCNRSQNTLKGYPPFCAFVFRTRTIKKYTKRDNETFCTKGVQIKLQTRTLISKNISLEITKRYYPGGKNTGKKVAEKTLNNVAPTKPLAPCQGAGCAQRPIKHNNNNNNDKQRTSPDTNESGFTRQDLKLFGKNSSADLAKKSYPINNNNNKPEESQVVKAISGLTTSQLYGVENYNKVNKNPGLPKKNEYNKYNAQNVNSEHPIKETINIPAILDVNDIPTDIPLVVPEMGGFELGSNDGNFFLIPTAPTPPLINNVIPQKVIGETFTQQLNKALEKRNSESLDFDHGAAQRLTENYKNLNEKLTKQEQKNNLELKLYEFYALYRTKGIVALTPAVINDLKVTLQAYKEHTSETFNFITEPTKNAQKLSVLLSNCNEVWKEPLLKLLKDDPIKECSTTTQYMKEYQRCINTLEFLKLYGNKIPESIVHELFYRINIIKHNDAMFFGDNFYPKVIVPEAEGSTVDKDVYKHMSNNFEKYFKIADIEISISKFYELFDLKNENYFIGHFKPYYIPLENKFADSGDEVHLHFMRKITLDNGQTIIISFGYFTSTKDSDTVKITNKQYINVDIPVKKDQLFRPFKFLVHINDDAITINESATKYAKTTNCEGINVQEVLINSILNNKEILIKNPIRKTHIITRELLQDIAENFYEERAKLLASKLETINKSYENLSESAKQLQDNVDKKYEEKTFKEQKEAVLKRTWPEYIRNLDLIKQKLEQQEKDEKQMKKSKNKQLAKQHYEKTRKDE